MGDEENGREGGWEGRIFYKKLVSDVAIFFFIKNWTRGWKDGRKVRREGFFYKKLV
jgi:hypothetical protein